MVDIVVIPKPILEKLFNELFSVKSIETLLRFINFPKIIDRWFSENIAFQLGEEIDK
jgi:hypothetical protein